MPGAAVSLVHTRGFIYSECHESWFFNYLTSGFHWPWVDMEKYDFYESVLEEVTDHLLKAVPEATVYEKPFPHFYVTQLFPESIYAQLTDSFPDQSQYQTYTKYNMDDNPTRFRVGLTQETLASMPAEKKALWLGVRDALGCPEVKTAVFRQLQYGLSLRFRQPQAEVEHIPAYPRPELYRETFGYEIKPHTDTRKKIVTMQIALPRDESQSELGTMFYRLSPTPTALLRHPKGFKMVKKIPFLPNSAYAFVVFNTITMRSWHGRDKLPPDCGIRNSLLHIYYDKPEHGDQELVERYYREK